MGRERMRDEHSWRQWRRWMQRHQSMRHGSAVGLPKAGKALHSHSASQMLPIECPRGHNRKGGTAKRRRHRQRLTWGWGRPQARPPRALPRGNERWIAGGQRGAARGQQRRLQAAWQGQRGRCLLVCGPPDDCFGLRSASV